ncbi:flavin reductase family protein [Micromonospora sp. NBC_00898]|uniref:flavin reductase family protein n=1 Tax=Micromonospora sp. NBC_00898 TaxID=2975981 RepID=UPI003870067F|nr:flavin reductase family protein [Micromonospora sp. NBC_00898]
MTTVDRPGVGAVELRPVDRDLFRALLHRQASTVTVVTVPGVAADRHLLALPPGEGWSRGPFGVPLIDDAPAVLLCRVVRRIEAGDQTTVLAEPLALGGVADADALVHHPGDHTNTFGPWPSPW